MGLIRWTVDPRATVRLRFDDEEFVAALIADDGDADRPLARLLGKKSAQDFDFSNFVADGVWMTARAGIRGDEEDELLRAMQQRDARQGVKTDPGAYNNLWFATWVLEVGADDGDLPKGLSSNAKRNRVEAVAALPTYIRDALFCRLRVHEDSQNAPAIRDPEKATGKTASP